MRRFNLKQKIKEPMTIALALFVLAFLFGLLFARLGSNLLNTDFDSIESEYFYVIRTQDTSYLNFFRYTLFQNLKIFCTFFILCITFLGIPYMALLLVKEGFNLGFLLMALCLRYQSKGMLLFLAYFFPQCLIYIPVIINCLKAGYRICILASANSQAGLKNISLLKSYRKLLIIMLGLLVIGAFLETIPGTILIRKIILWID